VGMTFRGWPPIEICFAGQEDWETRDQLQTAGGNFNGGPAAGAGPVQWWGPLAV
jgi:hypothetical protein